VSSGPFYGELQAEVRLLFPVRVLCKDGEHGMCRSCSCVPGTHQLHVTVAANCPALLLLTLLCFCCFYSASVCCCSLLRVPCKWVW
jgi:hypothetical protein